MFEIIRSRNGFARTVTIKFPNKVLVTPIYFPAISSFGIDLTENLVKFVLKLSLPYMLISAYDFNHIFEAKNQLTVKINRYSANNNFLFLDSGGYERKWNDDPKWDFEIYEKTLKKINCDFYASLDLMEDDVIKKNPFTYIIKSYPLLADSQFVGIFDGNNPKQLIENVKKFLINYNSYKINYLAFREKDLGVTLTEKATTVLKIRKIIDNLVGDQLIHILGCGNPLNQALYTYCGADIFDSRDWYLKTLDLKNMILDEFSHLELLNCNCKSCKISERRKYNPYVKTLYHNITGHLDYSKNLQQLVKTNKLKDFLIEHGISKKMLNSIN